MKPAVFLLFFIVCLACTLKSAGQNVYREYFDGEIYLKIKNDVIFAFDTTKPDVSIENKLPFLAPFITKYQIEKVKATFYFSKSDILKRTFRIYFKKAEAVKSFLSGLQELKQVDFAEQVPIMRTSYIPDDIGTNNATGQYYLYKIHAEDAWDVSRGSSSVKIAVVDNAIDINHPDLSGNVAYSRDVADNDNDPTPLFNNIDHGTHTSGLACASTNNTIGIASISFNCKLIAIKAMPDITTTGFITFGYEGVEWAVSNGASVVSCSWGGYGDCSTCQSVIDDAYANNVVVVASAGNDNTTDLHYPSGYNHVLSVASTDSNDVRSSFSNYGASIKICAPGENIKSTLPGNAYGNLSGTSMATPLVAGVCGLIRSINPFLSYNDVVNCIVNNADNINVQNPGFNGLLGSGRLNAYRALQCSLQCNANIDLGTTVYTIPKTESAVIITSANTIPNASHVILDAGTRVNLKPGFRAVSGSYFHTYIDGCGGLR